MPVKKSSRVSGAAEVKKLGAHIRESRRSAGMTQEVLAEKAEIATRVLQKIEAGQITILVTTLIRIRRALGCDYDDLLPE